MRVVNIAGGGALQRRLSDLGILAGRELTVLNRRGPGGVVVAIEDSRLALGYGTAQKVVVAPVT